MKNNLKKLFLKVKEKVSFGFYNSLIVFIFFTIAISRILYFSQDLLISYFPIVLIIIWNISLKALEIFLKFGKI